MEELYQQSAESVTGTMYKDIICHLMVSGKKDEAEKWAQRALENQPGDLDTYKGVLKYYYEIGDKNIFYNVLNRLKTSDIVLDRDTLEMVRFFK
jgi:hypothetical protein